jgi:hypothetical protein
MPGTVEIRLAPLDIIPHNLCLMGVDGKHFSRPQFTNGLSIYHCLMKLASQLLCSANEGPTILSTPTKNFSRFLLREARHGV